MVLLLLQLSIEFGLKTQAAARAAPVPLYDRGACVRLSLRGRGCASAVHDGAVAALRVIVRNLLRLQLLVQLFLKMLASFHAAPVPLNTNSACIFVSLCAGDRRHRFTLAGAGHRPCFAAR